MLDEAPQTRDRFVTYLATAWTQMYRLGDVPDYEPTPDASAAATAERQGRHPGEVVMDWLAESLAPSSSVPVTVSVSLPWKLLSGV